MKNGARFKRGLGEVWKVNKEIEAWKVRLGLKEVCKGGLEIEAWKGRLGK